MSIKASQEFHLLGPGTNSTSADEDDSLWSIEAATLRVEEGDWVTGDNYAVRVLLQRQSPEEIGPPPGGWDNGQLRPTPQKFHRPVVLAALIHQRDKNSFGNLEVRVAGLTGAYKVVPATPALEHADLVMQPIGEWPLMDGPRHFAVPSSRLLNGTVPLRIAPKGVKNPLALSEKNAQWVMLGNLVCGAATGEAEKGLEIALAPDGIQFAAPAPDALKQFAGIDAQRAVTLRFLLGLHVDGDKIVGALQLIGGPREFLDALERAIKLRFEALRSAGSPLHVDFDMRPDVPGLWWEVKIDQKRLSVTPNVFCIERKMLRARLLSGPPVDGGARCVAQVPVQMAKFEVDVGGVVTFTLLSTQAAPAAGAAITFQPDESGNMAASFTDDLPVGLDRDRLAEQLTERYRVAGVMPRGATIAPYAFVPLNVGWVQLPLTDCATNYVSAAGAKSIPSIITGSITWPLSKSADAVLEIAGASRVDATATWSLIGLATKVTLHGPSGVVRKLLFTADASPSPEEGLPSLEAGPVATRELPVRFGLQPHQEPCGRLRRIGAIDLRWTSRDQQPSEKTSQGVIWIPCDDLPLIPSMAMTRTVASGEPLHTRALVPRPFDIASGCTLQLNDNPLPSFTAVTIAVSTLWRWPWAIDNSASVSLVPPTLPDIEIRPQVAVVPRDPSRLEFRLRHDLALLDEYFASIQVPKSETLPPDEQGVAKPAAAAQLAATSLDPARLTAFWQLQADRVALTRTQSSGLSEWLIAGGSANVTTLYEPFNWRTTLAFSALAGNGLRIGQYELDKKQYWGWQALQGLEKNFAIQGNSQRDLQVDADGTVQVLGNAASVRLEAGIAYDSRGFGMSTMLEPRSHTPSDEPSLHLRRTRYLTAETSLPLELATLSGPVALTHGQNSLRFWCRDLPVSRENVTSPWKFSGSQSRTETVAGPDPHAFDREAVQRSLAEWRFYAAGKRRFDIDLGPFRFRPLRLWFAALQDAAAGSGALVQTLQIIGSLQLFTDEEEDRAGPFGHEDAYSTGNLVALTLKADGETPIAWMERVQIIDGMPTIIPYVDRKSAPPPMEFALEAPVSCGERKTARTQTLVLRLYAGKKAVPDAEPLYFPIQDLDIALFGSACRLAKDTALALESATKDLKVSFERPKKTSASTPLPAAMSIASVSIKATDAKAECSVSMSLDLRAEENKDLPVIEWKSDGSFRWLGIHTTAEPIVDHARGTMRFVLPRFDAHDALLLGIDAAGSEATAVLLLAAALPADGSNVPLPWPTGQIAAGYAELRARYPSQLVIRHAIEFPDPKQPGAVKSGLYFDILRSKRESSIRWPLKSIELQQDSDEGQLLRSAGTDEFWIHSVEVEGYSLPCSLALISRVKLPNGAATDQFHLAGRLAGLMRARHTLYRGTEESQVDVLSWSTLENVELLDYYGLVDSADDESAKAGEASAKRKQSRYGYAARWRTQGYRGVKNPSAWLAHQGIATRAFAAAGVPDLSTAIALGQAQRKFRLLLMGGSITLYEVSGRSTEEAPTGFRWVLPWIAQLTSATNDLADSPLRMLQAPTAELPERKYRIAKFDGHAGDTVTWEHARPIALEGTGTQAFIAKSLLIARKARFGDEFPPGQTDAGTTFELSVVEQPLIELLDQQLRSVAFDNDSLKYAPLFLRSLLALRKLYDAAHRKQTREPLAPSAFSNLVPTSTDSAETASRILRVAIVSPPATERQRPANSEPDAWSLIVVGRDGVSITDLAAETAGDLANSAGVARIRSAAVAKKREPLMILVAGRDPDVAIDEKHPWHDDFTAAEVSALPADFPVRRRPLANPADTLFASSALGWPDDLDLGDVNGDTLIDVALEPSMSGAHVHDAPFQNSEQGLSGRVARFNGVTFAGSALDPTTPENDCRFFLWTHRHVTFDRSNSDDVSAAPPARHLNPGRTRLRVPSAEQTRATLGRLASGAALLDRFQSILPGEYERVVMGARPGVLYTEVDATLVSRGSRPLDPDLPHFGQPATATPLIVRQQRHPRSVSLPGEDDPELTRRTFVSWANTLGGKKQLREPVLAVQGPATLFRKGDAESSVLLQLHETADQKPGVLTINAGTLTTQIHLRVTITAAGTVDAKQYLYRVGLLRENVTYAFLKAGGRTLHFTKLGHGEVQGKPNEYFVTLSEFDVDDKTEIPEGDDQFALRALVQQVSGDSPLRLVIGLGEECADDFLELPDVIDLARPSGNNAEAPLRAQPARVLTLPLQVDPGNRPVAQSMQSVLCAFGDPSYDRDLASETERAVRSVLSGVKSEDWLLASDRVEYNADSVVYFAVGAIDADGAWIETDPAPIPVHLEVLRLDPQGKEISYHVRIADAPVAEVDKAAHLAVPATAHAVPLNNLRRVEDKQTLEPFALRPTDRLRIAATLRDAATLSVEVAIVANPVVASPPAIYAVITGVLKEKHSDVLDVPLYACAPAPQSVEFPDLRGDLARGMVRRRGLFLWNFVRLRNQSHVALIKLDRSGGGQLIDSADDFRPIVSG